MTGRRADAAGADGPDRAAVSAATAAPRPAAGWRAEAAVEIQRSRFIAWAARADSEAAARDLFAEARQRYPDARHHCTAFIVADGPGPPVSRSSDDGEPPGTAGRPMLAALAGSGLVDVAAVVTRYFGGVKLGAGGLVRAYGGAVQLVLADVPRVVPAARPLWRFQVGHGEAGRIAEELRRRGVTVADWAYEAAAVTLSLVFPADIDAPGLLAQIGQGAGTATPAGWQVAEVPHDGSSLN
ncbi:MAG: YigZ family protein [Propionibacteriaceae bacterium]|jgi:uncharacterized YigZ family protein|nr:YigZ family protein [Propionibacteriaceae bacterium]